MPKIDDYYEFETRAPTNEVMDYKAYRMHMDAVLDRYDSPDSDNNKAKWYEYDKVLIMYNSIQKTIDDILRDGKFTPHNFRAWTMGPETTRHDAANLFVEKEASFVCLYGHRFRSTLSKVNAAVVNGDAPETLCSSCARLMSRNQRLLYRDTRMMYSMVRDERNEFLDLKYFKGVTEPAMVVQYGATPMRERVHLTNQKTNYRPNIKNKKVWIAHDNEYAFVYAGQWDNSKTQNPLTRDLIDNGIIELYFPPDIEGTQGTRGKQGIQQAIAELREDGAKVLNIMWNPDATKVPGVYTFEDFTTTSAALANYLKVLEQKWLDWQQDHGLGPKRPEVE